MLMTVRADEVDLEQEVSGWLDGLSTSGWVGRVVLRRRRPTTSVFGSSVIGPSIPAELAEDLQSRTAGNAFFSSNFGRGHGWPADDVV